MATNSPDTATNPDASTVLAQIRERHNEMLVRERERKRRIAAACKPFARARAAVADAEASYTKTVDDLERRRAAAEARRDEKVAQRRREMAATVQAIRREDISAAEVATLLGLSQAEVRDLGQMQDDAPDDPSARPTKRSGTDRPGRSETSTTARGGVADGPAPAEASPSRLGTSGDSAAAISGVPSVGEAAGPA